MKCPLKEILAYDIPCHETDDNATAITTETDFNDCDKKRCFAYDKNAERCTMVIDVFEKLNGGNINAS